MSNVAHDDKSFVFDLDSSQGIAELLLSIRSSKLESSVKNELRDSVLSFTNGGKDESSRLDLERKIRFHNIESVHTGSDVSKEYKEYSDVNYEFGTIRPHPVFFNPKDIKVNNSIDNTTVGKEDSNNLEGGIKKTIQANDDSKNNIKLSEDLQSSKPPLTEPLPTQPHFSPVSIKENVSSATKDNEELSRVPHDDKAEDNNDSNQENQEDDFIKRHTVNFDNLNTPSSSPSSTGVNLNKNTNPDYGNAGQVSTGSKSDQVVSFDSKDNLRRIKEIKSLVNDRIGNPVKLVEINNEVGREYMSTLLDAMKRINSGQSVITAMKKLEDVFVRVNKIIDDYKLKQSTQETSPLTSADETSKVEVKNESVSAVDSVVSSTTQSKDGKLDTNLGSEVKNDLVNIVEPVNTNVDFKNSKQKASIKFSPISESVKPEHSSATNMMNGRGNNRLDQSLKSHNNPDFVNANVRKVLNKVPPTNQVTTHSLKESVTPASNTPDSPYVKSKNTYASNNERKGGNVKEIKPSEVSVANNIKSNTVAGQSSVTPDKDMPVSLGDSDLRIKKPEDLPAAKTIYTTDDNDPLYTLDVDNGLEQLLLEWPIFRKSGLFGTGPKGRNHPLFLKISKLQIPLLLAGRFEGATQEVRQSITDYMNGWRYEQGIIYEQGEEFEHYLRRVVKHILDLQKS